MRSLVRAAGVALLVLATGSAFADCVEDISVAEARAAFTRAQAAESKSDSRAAVLGYRRAQGYTCDPNPVAADAARRAAPLALALAKAAEQAGRLAAGSDTAFAWYEAGGHYAQADRVLWQAVQARRDDVALYDLAQRHFNDRSQQWFQSNNKLRIGITGAYSVDPKIPVALTAMPAANVGQALAREARLFDENYARELVQLAQSQRDAGIDFVVGMQAQQAQAAFQTKWKTDPMQASREVLRQAGEWARRAGDEEESLRQSVDKRGRERGERLLAKYAGAPQLLEDATDYFGMTGADDRVPAVRKAATAQGEAAQKRNQLALAARFFQLAGDDKRADALREQLETETNAQVARQYGATQAQAEKLKNDPDALEAFKRKAQEAPVLKEKSAAEQKKFKAEQDALEDELGL